MGLALPKPLQFKRRSSEPLSLRRVRPQSLGREDLAELGKRMAETHRDGASPHVRGGALFSQLSSDLHALEFAYSEFAKGARIGDSLTPGVEWFLDNYHIVEKQILDIRKHFPRGYDRSLPKLKSGAYAGFPRVYPIAFELLAHTDAVLEPALLNTFLTGYQNVTILSIGEVWAIPIMLRFALLETLKNLTTSMLKSMEERKLAERFITEIIGDDTRPGTEILLKLASKLVEHPEFLLTGAPNLIRRLRDRGPRASLTLQWLEERLRESGNEPEELLRSEQYFLAADQISIANTITSLRALTFINWREWFEQTCKVEQVLRADPSGVYSESDFESRDECRRVVELVSRRSPHTEIQVAAESIRLARETITAPSRGPSFSAPKESCVSYYLLSKGKEKLLEKISYKPSLKEIVGAWFQRNSFPTYSIAIISLTAIFVSYIAKYVVGTGVSLPLATLLLVLITMIPAADVATAIVQWIVTKLTKPCILPKLDFSRELPAECRTVTIVHALFTEIDSVNKAIEALHVRSLSNDDPNILFGILADLKDADEAILPLDSPIKDRANLLIKRLNEEAGIEKYFVLFRRRIWNDSEKCWMGWERKRGKIEEFNNLLLGGEDTSFELTTGIIDKLRTCRFVITLDNDTQLPRGTAKKLIGAIAHPLNRPVIDPRNNVVVDGYGVIQPRVGVSLTSAHSSKFALIFSGHSGLDPYTQTVSDVYQDFFGEASFVGKAIYDLKAFHDTLSNRVPENALLSHDLFESLFARCALASDIELFDDFPSKYHVHARRQHRWTRGDWQLLPWTGRRIPDAARKRYRSPISNLGRWKLIDNLRRSLVPPCILAILLGGFSLFPGSPFVWVLGALLVFAFPVFTNMTQAFSVPPQGISLSGHIRGVGKDVFRVATQCLVALSFLPHQAVLMVHAIVLTLYRLAISKKHLLEWESAYHSEKRLGLDLTSFLREMRWALVLVLFSAALLGLYIPERLPIALPFLALWIGSPILAKRLSSPKPTAHYELPQADREYLRVVGYETWRYFFDNLDERHNYLIPDNLQLVPNRVIAERTSPTNISLSILSALSACDLGFVPLTTSVDLTSKIFNTLSQLERYHGHFLNWYATTSMQPLLPRYVSTVDSGNLVGHFVSIRSALEELKGVPFLTEAHVVQLKWLFKTLGKEDLISKVKGIRDEDVRTLGGVHQLIDLVAEVNLQSLPEFYKRDVQEFGSLLKLFAWIHPLDDAIEASKPLTEFNRINEELTELSTKLDEMSLSPRVLNDWLGELMSLAAKCSADEALQQSVRDAFSKLLESASDSRLAIRDLIAAMNSVQTKCERFIESIDFSFLYDYDKDLFIIGYNVDTARKDPSYYDLLASEARLGSFLAIARDQIPQKHWFSLGRSLAETSGGKALFSWSGTMFEYLMPLLVMKDFPQTLLSESYKAVVKAQQLYGDIRGVPWGISESAYSGVDFEKTYQYRAFGVPGLGLKRGLEDDLTVSPYSTCLALMVDAISSVKNLRRLDSKGIRGEYGFYESIDYTPSRLAADEKYHVVKSFFAHHQGMSLVAINNVLSDGIFQRRFHSDPRVRTCELLLHERFPDRLPAIGAEEPLYSPMEAKEQREDEMVALSIHTPHTFVPRTHLLSNGRYTLMIDNGGGGYSALDRELMLTRWREDAMVNRWGTFIYVRDLDSGEVWSTGFQPTLSEPDSYEVVFGPDKAEFKRRDKGIFSHTSITVSPEDDVEVRRISFANLSKERRRLEVTSYAEVSLAPLRADAAHPAFSKMFIESEFLADLDAILFARRPRSKHEERLYLLHLVSMRRVWEKTQFETSKTDFIGRGKSARNPCVMSRKEPLSGKDGFVLDPIMSLRVVIELQPGETEYVTFLTGASRDKDEIMRTASKFRDFHQVARAFEMAWSQSSVELRNERISARQAQVFQRLANSLMYNVEKVRAEPEVILRNRLGQSGLWRFGISGDMPIALVIIAEPNQVKLVEELLRAHYYLRSRGFQFDLVILNEYPGGYLQNLQEELEMLVRSSLSGALIDKKGGIFIRTSQQLSEVEKDLLLSVARVVVSGIRGSLGSQIKFDDGAVDWLPVAPIRECLSKVGSELAGTLDFWNGVGGFLRDGNGYKMRVTDTELPPLPWSNVIANPEFGCMVTELGSGNTWCENSRENRLTPWSNDPVTDPPGEVLYIRDAESGDYWCPTPRPVSSGNPVDVVHGIGYSQFLTSRDSISSKFTITVSSEAREKWWGLELTNNGNESREIEVILYVEFLLGVTRDESYRHLVTLFDDTAEALCALNHYNNEFASRVVYLSSTETISGFTGSRREFVGRNRDLRSPLALDKSQPQSLLKGITTTPVKLSNRTGAGVEPCGTLKVAIKIPPKSTREVSFFMGEAMSLAMMRKRVEAIKSEGAFNKELSKTRSYFERLSSPFSIATPNRSFDLLMNKWLLYQTISCRIFGRSAFYQSGGAWGFRDQLQDTMSFLFHDSSLVRKQLLLHASRQFVEGDVQHWWHPPTGRGVRTRFTDDLHWMPYVALRYVEVTGDDTIWDEQVSFIEGPQLAPYEMETYIVPHQSTVVDTFYDHCVRALDRGLGAGSHGLPLIGGGDWNDGMNDVGKDGKGESVWLGWFISKILKDFSNISDKRGDIERANKYRDTATKFVSAVEASAWDGAWYRRAYQDDGTPIGSSANDECQIDSLAQSWSVITGLGRPDRAKQAMKSLEERLVDEKNEIIKLLTPPFDRGSLEPGYIKGYLPGIRENGAQYTHAATWVVIAESMLGEGDKALKFFDMLNPINHTSSPQRVAKYQGEPYVLCGDVYSEPPHAGRAGWSWYTGSSGWMYQAGLRYILGLEIKPDHFTVSPCIPTSWKEFSLSFERGGATYKIHVENPKGVSKGVTSVTVDGIAVEGNVVKFLSQDSNATVSVKVSMG